MSTQTAIFEQSQDHEREVKQLYLDTAQRSRGDTTNAVFSFNNEGKFVEALSIKSVTMPNLFYNVPPGSSITYKLVAIGANYTAGGEVTVPIASGRYDSVGLVAALNAATTGIITWVLNISVNGGLHSVSWSHTPATSDVLVLRNGNGVTDLTEQLGITDTDISNRAGAAVSAGDILHLEYPLMVHIRSNALAQAYVLHGSTPRQNILMAMTTTSAPHGGYIHFESGDVKQDLVWPVHPFNLTTDIDLYLTDSKGRKLVFGSGENATTHGFTVILLASLIDNPGVWQR